MKERLDVLLVKEAAGTIQGKGKGYRSWQASVFVRWTNGRTRRAPCLTEKVEIEVQRAMCCKYVSRGGLKLEKAMDNFDITLDGKVCMDVGSSTGGFTDCMLQNGAVKVYSVDVGYGQLDWKLRQDPTGCLYGEDKYPLCDAGRYSGAAGICLLLMYPLFR